MRDVRLTKWVVILLFINLLDAATTVAGLSTGIAKEMNPLMAVAWDLSPLVFLTIKLIAPMALLLLMLRRSKNAQHTLIALRGLAVLFGAVVLWNTGNLALIHALS